MPTRWLDPAPVTVPDDLRETVGGHPLVSELLMRRGIITPEDARTFLDPDAYHPALPFDLPDMDRAVERIQWAIHRSESICIWGDFDVDGQTSTALLVSTLRDLGAQVDYHIPNRQNEGHGINRAHLQQVIDAGAKLIITCDTGISARDAVDYAKSCHVDMIITDHHSLPSTLPRARAVVNPQRLPENHPLRELPGVGVTYKLVEALGGESSGILDLVALGIVADVAEQVRDTRYLLQRGLQALRATNRIGLQAIFELTELNPVHLNEEDISFTLAPRLNALGRLEDASLAVELLTTHDLERARILAQRLENLNGQRKLLVEQVYRAAQAQIARDSALLDSNVLVLAYPHWNGGVVGIVANRLAEQYHRPVIVLVTPLGEMARGSARSVEGVDITAALSLNAHLLAGFGGHAMAAGLSLPPENIPNLRRALARSITLPTSDPVLSIDSNLKLSDLTPAFVADLERLAPFGARNPAPVFADHNLAVRNHHAVGRGDEHQIITVVDAQSETHRVIWWRGGKIAAARFDLAFTVRTVDYRGESQLQIEWIDSRPAAGVIEVRAPALEIIDYRGADDSLARLYSLTDAVIWREADSTVSGQTRFELTPARELAIWTIPPSSANLRAVIERVQPEKLYLFAADPGLDSLESFIKRLAGLVKFALSKRDGVVSLAALAAATAQHEKTVRAGLDWLVAHGQIALISEEGETLTLAAATDIPAADLALYAERLTALLRETAAYRAFYRRVDPQHLLAE